MRHTITLYSLLVFSVCLALGGGLRAASEPDQEKAPPTVRTEPSETFPTPVLRVLSRQGIAIDPDTGELRHLTAEERARWISENLRRSLSTSTEGLKERPSPVPGGGVVLDLEGRFQSVLWVQLTEDGPKTGCGDMPPELVTEASDLTEDSEVQP